MTMSAVTTTTTTTTATASQHENGASRPFSFLPKRRRSKSYSATSNHEELNDMAYDNDNNNNNTAAYHPDYDYAASTSQSQDTHVFPTTATPTSPTTPKHQMHIDIPPSARIQAPTPVRPPTFIRKKSGELVKPSLKSTSSFASTYIASATSSPSPSPASRPRTTSAPATPMAHKSVHFDTQLERVKLFLSGQKPLAVSREGSPVDMDTTSASEAEPDTFGISSYPFPTPKSRYGTPTSSALSNPGSSSIPAVNKSSSQPRMKLKLIPIYTPHPVSNPAVEPWSFDVRLESVRLSTPDSPTGPSPANAKQQQQDAFPQLHGTILVHNKAFTKSIFFRYTLDDWNTVSEVSCKHVHTLPGGIYDRFEYRVKLIGLLSSSTRSEGEMASNVPSPFKTGSGASSFGPGSQPPPARMEFCVRYNVPGWGEWWDSNNGTNYVVEFKWEPETPTPALPSSIQTTKIVAPQPQRATAASSGLSTTLFQRMARHSVCGTSSPGHVSPPPHSGPGSVSMLDQRPPMPSPSFPPSFSSLGHSDYFNYNKPQAMGIPLRSRYDFGVSFREGAKITGPTVTSPLSSPRSPTAGISGLPLMSPTTVPGVFRHTLATPAKKGKENAGEAAVLDSSSTTTLTSMPESSAAEDSSPGLPSTSKDTLHSPPPSPRATSGRRHVRSWIQTSMSEQDMSNDKSPEWAGVGVRKTMSSPAKLALDENTTPSPPLERPHRSIPYSDSDVRHRQLSQHDGGDEEEESEEDGIWFGRRSSVGSDVQGTGGQQSDYEAVTSAMRHAMFGGNARTSPLLRFKNMGTLGVVDEGKEVEREQGEESSSSTESSSSSLSFLADSPLTYTASALKDENEKPSFPTSPSSSVMWSLSSSTGSSDASTTPRVSTPPLEAQHLPLLNAKLASAVLSGTPKSASPMLGAVEGVDVVPTLRTGVLSAEMLYPPYVPPQAVMSPSSEGSITPKGEVPSSEPSTLSASAGAGAGATVPLVGSKGINLNSSSYHSLLDQFCFFTGTPSSSKSIHAYPQTSSHKKLAEPSRERSPPAGSSSSRGTDSNHGFGNSTIGRTGRSGVGVRFNVGDVGGGGRSSSADPNSNPNPSSSLGRKDSPSPPSHHGGNFNSNFGLNLGFGFDGFASVSMNDTHSSLPYGIPRSLGRSLSDPPENFLIRSAYGGEQVSGSVG